ncbi:hypothetical protein F4861DRAFT_543008 [Xylaria intraflava]|nr:hypothetical protein F4861DRAFT_543008 [Xylaria intraflava]
MGRKNKKTAQLRQRDEKGRFVRKGETTSPAPSASQPQDIPLPDSDSSPDSSPLSSPSVPSPPSYTPEGDRSSEQYPARSEPNESVSHSIHQTNEPNQSDDRPTSDVRTGDSLTHTTHSDNGQSQSQDPTDTHSLSARDQDASARDRTPSRPQTPSARDPIPTPQTVVRVPIETEASPSLRRTQARSDGSGEPSTYHTPKSHIYNSSSFTEYRSPSDSSSSSRSAARAISSQTLRPKSVVSLISRFDELNMADHEQAESSAQGAMRNVARQNPERDLGGDARRDYEKNNNDGGESNRGPRMRSSIRSTSPISQLSDQVSIYTESDHCRDAAMIREILEGMAFGEYRELQSQMTSDVTERARAVLRDLTGAEIVELYQHAQAMGRVERVTRSSKVFEAFLYRFMNGPSAPSPGKVRKDTNRFNESFRQSTRRQSYRRDASAGPQPRERRLDPDDFEVISHGPAQHGWKKTAQPLGDEAQGDNLGRRKYNDIRMENHGDEGPDDEDSYAARGYRNNRDNNRSTFTPKIEHQLFTYTDAQPVSTYISKLDHLIRRFGEKVVMDNLVVGILLDADSPGARWYMSLPEDDKETFSTNYARFKTAITQRFGRNRNEMMRKGDQITHSFTNEDTFSVYDYIDEKLKWYTEAGNLSEDWQTLRIYNNLDDHLKARVTTRLDCDNTIADLRQQISVHKDAAYEEWKKRKTWTESQEKQIRDVRSMINSRRDDFQRRNRETNRSDGPSGQVQMPAEYVAKLKPVEPKPATRDDSEARDSRPWGYRPNWGRNNWRGNRYSNNNNGGRPFNDRRETTGQQSAGNHPPEMRDAKVFVVDGNPCLQDEESGQTYHLPEEDLPSILEQMDSFQTPIDTDPSDGTLDHPEDESKND